MPPEDESPENPHIRLELINEQSDRYLLKFMGLHSPLPVVAEVGVGRDDLRDLRRKIDDALGEEDAEP